MMLTSKKKGEHKETLRECQQKNKDMVNDKDLDGDVAKLHPADHQI